MKHIKLSIKLPKLPKIPKLVRPRDSLRTRLSLSVGLVLFAMAIITNAITLLIFSPQITKGRLIISLIMIIVFVISGSFLTYIFTESVVAPMEEFKNAAKRISSGDFKVRLEVKGSDEVAELSEAFNYMCAELEHLDEKRSEFVSDASHELKTPMTTIKLISDTLVSAENPDTEMVKEFLNDLSEEIDRLTRIVERLLKLSELESSGKPFKRELADYAMLVNKIVAKLEPVALEKSVTVSVVNRTENMQPVAMDVDKMWEAVYNIIDNAIKYTKIGSTVTVELGVKEGKLLTLIRDEGQGIPDKFKEKIFERFYRIDDSRARDTGGTGLGLAIAKEIMTAHNGEITVRDGANGGSIFVLSIPYDTNPQIAPVTPEVEPEPTDLEKEIQIEEKIKEQDALYEEELSATI